MVDRVLSLNEIPYFVIGQNFPFRRIESPHATIPEPKPKIGILGMSGEGKSLLMSVIAHCAFMVRLERVWSNIKMKYTWNISDDLARMFGLVNGGQAVYEAERFIDSKMYRMDPDYRDGCYALDEINVQLADSLKFNTNANFYFNQVDQQLRKDKNGLIWTSIHEMWVDSRVREVTDIMIKCYDTALSPEGIESQKPRGVNIELWVYPMTRYLTGRTWTQHGEKYGPIYFNAKRWWGIFDTYQKQATGKKYAKGLNELLGENDGAGQAQTGTIVYQEYYRWGWLYDIIQGLKESGLKEIQASDFFDLIGDYARQFDKSQIGVQLTKMGIQRKGYGSRTSPLRYIIPDYDIIKNPEEKRIRMVKME